MFIDFVFGQPVAYGIYEHTNLDWLCNKVVHTFLDKHFFDIPDDVGSERYNGYIIVLGVETPDNACCLDSVNFRHHMIHQDEVVHGLGYFADCLVAAECCVNLHVKRLEKPLRHSQVDGVIIHDEDFRRLGGKIIIFIGRLAVILADCLMVVYAGK